MATEVFGVQWRRRQKTGKPIEGCPLQPQETRETRFLFGSNARDSAAGSSQVKQLTQL